MSFSRAFAEDNNEVALALFGKSLDERGNLFFSPFSVRTVLGMMCVGARGETAAQMTNVLRLSSSSETNDYGLADLIQRLNSSGGGKYEVAVALSVWAQCGDPLRAEFIAMLEGFYRGSMNHVDFRDGAEAASAAINRWVEEHTRQNIRGMVSSADLRPDTGLILVNAVYFKGLWERPFQTAATLNEPFYLERGGQVGARLMHQESEIRYLQADGFQVVDLDYQGGDMSMLILLPQEIDGLHDLEGRLSATILRDSVSKMERRKVKVALPKFRMTWSAADLKSWLSALGMPLAFARSLADFSGINGCEPPHANALFISTIFQKAFVNVNEEGTEATAATLAVFLRGMPDRDPPPVPIFRADHPFLFAIRDRYSDSILFFGRMSDPTKAS